VLGHLKILEDVGLIEFERPRSGAAMGWRMKWQGHEWIAPTADAQRPRLVCASPNLLAGPSADARSVCGVRTALLRERQMEGIVTAKPLEVYKG
jgi:hypothetical protein